MSDVSVDSDNWSVVVVLGDWTATIGGTGTLKRMAKIEMPVSQVRRYLEPGPIVPVSSALDGARNIMTLGWHTVMEFMPCWSAASSPAATTRPRESSRHFGRGRVLQLAPGLRPAPLFVTISDDKTHVTSLLP